MGPLALAVIVIGYLSFVESHTELSVWMIPPALLLAAIFIFRPQINMWWWRRNPPRLSPELRGLLYKSLPSLRVLTPEQLELFDLRMSLYLRSSEFTKPGVTDVPEDVHAAILAPWIYLSLDQDKPYYQDYQRIVLYKHPFLSPLHPDTVHSAEQNAEDGVMIISNEQLVPGLLDPHTQFHLPAYLAAEAYLLRHEMPGHVSEHYPRARKADDYSAVLGLPVDEQALRLHHALIYDKPQG